MRALRETSYRQVDLTGTYAIDKLLKIWDYQHTVLNTYVQPTTSIYGAQRGAITG